MKDYRRAIFDRYASVHTDYLDSDVRRIAWYRGYLRANYLPLLPRRRIERGRILEIGCGRGQLLRALADLGATDLTGIDLSGGDLERAKEISPRSTFLRCDAFDYLRQNRGRFDIVFAKAILEHVEKDRVLELLERINEALAEGGVVIIDVPNMDWLFAGHERYMDFTHEVGFTRESLRQVMHCVYDDVQVRLGDELSELGRRRRLIARTSRWLIGLALHGTHSDSPGDAIWVRNLVALGRRRG